MVGRRDDKGRDEGGDVGVKWVANRHSKGVELESQRWGFVDAFEIWQACGHGHYIQHTRAWLLCIRDNQTPLVGHHMLGIHGQVMMVLIMKLAWWWPRHWTAIEGWHS